MPGTKQEWYVFTVLAVVGITAVLYLFAPSFTALILALTLTIMFRPIFGWILKLTRGRKGIAAGLTVFLSVLIIFIPLSLFVYQILQELQGAYDLIAKASGPQGWKYDPLFKLGKLLPDLLAKKFSASFSTSQLLTRTTDWIVEHIDVIFSNISDIILSTFVALMGMYYFLKDGGGFREKVIRLTPLPNHYVRRIFNDMETTAASTIRGTLVIAVVQGLLTGIGFYLFQVPSPVLWGSVTVVASLFPVIGTGLTTIPASLYLFSQGLYPQAIGMLAWGTLLVGTIDNLLRPYAIRKGDNLHPFLILLAVLGGFAIFGPIGFLAGPLTLSFFFALLSIYVDAVKNEDDPPTPEED
jgi:predicted PurR-regulated permease PerM